MNCRQFIGSFYLVLLPLPRLHGVSAWQCYTGVWSLHKILKILCVCSPLSLPGLVSTHWTGSGYLNRNFEPSDRKNRSSHCPSWFSQKTWTREQTAACRTAVNVSGHEAADFAGAEERRWSLATCVCASLTGLGLCSSEPVTAPTRQLQPGQASGLGQWKQVTWAGDSSR